MRVPDISVSKYHAIIEYHNDHSFLKDNNLKKIIKKIKLITRKIKSSIKNNFMMGLSVVFKKMANDLNKFKIELEIGRTTVTVSCEANS